MSNVENLAKENNRLIRCQSCASLIEYSARFCPYCGSTNEIGDELSYQDKLEDIREDMEELGDIPDKVIKDEVMTSAKRLKKMAIVAATVLVVIFIIYMVASVYRSRSEDVKIKEQIAWERENYGTMDELYEADDFDAIREFYKNYYLTLEWEKHSMSYWEHDYFMSVYEIYAHMNDILNTIELYPERAEYEKTDVFEDAAKLYYTDWEKGDYRKQLNAKDCKNIEEYRTKALEVLSDHFLLSQDDMENMRNELFDFSFSSYSPDGNKCRDKGRQLDWLD